MVIYKIYSSDTAINFIGRVMHVCVHLQAIGMYAQITQSFKKYL